MRVIRLVAISALFAVAFLGVSHGLLLPVESWMHGLGYTLFGAWCVLSVAVLRVIRDVVDHFLSTFRRSDETPTG